MHIASAAGLELETLGFQAQVGSHWATQEADISVYIMGHV